MSTIRESTVKTFRLQWIDAIKGGSILLVLLAHTNLAPVGENPYADCILRYVYYAMASYMPVFFVASGYTFKDSPEVIKKKFKQIIIPYVCFALIYLILFIIISILKGDIYPLHWCKKLLGCVYARCDLYANDAGFAYPIQPPGVGPLWFLPALFVSYVMYLPLHRAQKKVRYGLIGLYMGISLAMHQCPVLLPWSVDSSFVGALFICFGAWLKSSGMMNKPYRWSVLIAMCVVPIYVWLVDYNGGSGGMYCRNFGSAGWYAPLLFLMMGITGSFLWCMCFSFLEKFHLAYVFSRIGRHTLALLCVHMLVYFGIAWLFRLISSYYPEMEQFSPFCFIAQVLAALVFVSIGPNLKLKLGRG